jgi:hypothetical protein
LDCRRRRRKAEHPESRRARSWWHGDLEVRLGGARENLEVTGNCADPVGRDVGAFVAFNREGAASGDTHTTAFNIGDAGKGNPISECSTVPPPKPRGEARLSVASAFSYIGYIGQGIAVGDLFGLRGREVDVAAAQQWATYWLLASVFSLAGSIGTDTVALPVLCRCVASVAICRTFRFWPRYSRPR